MFLEGEKIRHAFFCLGISPELVAVYSVTDQRLKQAVPFPGGRHVGCYDGTILLAGTNQVI